MKKPFRFDLLRVIEVKRVFLEPLWLSLVSIRVDRAWNKVPDLKMHYWATELIFRWPLQVRFRLDIAKYFLGGYLEEHIDGTREDEKQFNSIFTIRKAESGGELIAEKFVYCGSRLKIVEVNRYKHEVTRVEKGERLIANFSVRYPTEKNSTPPW